MTKLSDAIQAARRRGGRALGFGPATQSTDRPKRGLLIAALGPDRHGADVHVLSSADRLVAAIEAAGDAPVGVAMEPLTAQAVTAAEEAEAAFVIFDPASTTADALLAENLEYGVRVSPGMTDETELRALGSLRPVIVVTEAAPDPLPVTALLALRRLAMLTGAPLALPVPADASESLLRSLRDSGVAVLLLESPSEADVEGLRERIAAIPEVSRKGREESRALVPALGAPEEDEFEDWLEA